MDWHPKENLTMEPAEDEAYESVMHVNLRIEGTSHFNHDFPGITQYRTWEISIQTPSNETKLVAFPWAQRRYHCVIKWGEI